MKKMIKKLIFLTCLLAVLVLPYFVFAAPNNLVNNLVNTGTGAGYAAETNETSISAMAGTIVSALLSLLGVIFVSLIIYAGIIWMTAEGDEQKIEKAKKTLRNAIIGLILTVSATAIYYLIQKIFR